MVAHTILLEISCRGSNSVVAPIVCVCFLFVFGSVFCFVVHGAHHLAEERGVCLFCFLFWVCFYCSSWCPSEHMLGKGEIIALLYLWCGRLFRVSSTGAKWWSVIVAFPSHTRLLFFHIHVYIPHVVCGVTSVILSS